MATELRLDFDALQMRPHPAELRRMSTIKSVYLPLPLRSSVTLA